MISFLYQRHGKLLLWLVALSFPFFYWQASSIRSNNDIETWLPRDTGVRQEYEQFKRDFGVEEIIVVALEQSVTAPALTEAVAGRIGRLQGVRTVWTADRMTAQMAALGVAEDEAVRRLDGLLGSASGQLVGLIALLDDYGATHRAEVVRDVKQELDYCQLTGDAVALTGAPVIVAELDRLGSQAANKKFFLVTVLLCLGLLYFSFGHWGMSLATLGVTLWGIYVTQTVLSWCGGEMNFIMGSLSVMVMVFTLSIAVHFVSYYADAKQQGHAEPLTHALCESWNPCFLSTLTTLLGLVSLNVSSILPVAQFGYAAGLGAIVALVVGLGVMPALLIVWPHVEVRSLCFRLDFGRWGDCIAERRSPLLGLMAVLVAVTGLGLMQLRSDVDPVEFLPRHSAVFHDLKRIEHDLTNVDSIEAIVDFGSSELPFIDRMLKVRTIQESMAKHPGVRHVLSAATFFPVEMPDSALDAARMLSRAKSMSQDSGWVIDEHRFWRISARIRRSQEFSPIQVLADLDQMVADEPVRFTGLTPLLKSAQIEIFGGFWQSFTAACLTISLVMIWSLRSFVLGVVAMIPNIIPIWLVFGSVGFLGMPVDIGMMMTGSISLGISVDCTFHFLVHYREAYNQGCTSAEATRRALAHSGEPMLESTVICSVGMLALCLSSFVPTARFGALMAAQMVASLLGELVILPALLCCRPARRTADASPTCSPAVTAPHFELTAEGQAWSAPERHHREHAA